MSPSGEIWILENNYTGVWNSRILHSSDGGELFSTAYTLSGTRLLDLKLIGSSKMIAVGTGGTCLCTNNGGLTWQESSNGLSGTLTSVFFTDSICGWAVGDSIFHTANGGITWSKQESGTHPLLYGVMFLDANSGWAVGERGTILHTTDGGTVWQSEVSTTRQTLYSVCFQSPTCGWASGISGLLLHFGEPDAAEQNTRELIPQSLSLAVYPNPFNSIATLSFSLPAASVISLVVYDVAGREVAVLNHGMIAAGTHRYALNASAFSGGMYFVRLNAANTSLTKKIVLLR